MKPGSEEYREATKTMITGSEMAAACGLNPFPNGTRQKLWEWKVNGIKKPFTPEEKERMDRGVRDEPKAVEWFKNTTGLPVTYPVEFCRSDRYPMYGCTPDALVGDGGLLEVKRPYSVYSDIPIYYLTQIVGQMAITDRWICDFLAWTPEEQKLWRVHCGEGSPDEHPAWLWMLPYLEEMLRYVTEKKKPPRFKKKPDGRELRELIDYEVVGTWVNGKQT